jgi:hypothetical protein
MPNRNACEGDILHQRFERNCHARDVAFMIGRKCDGKLTG